MVFNKVLIGLVFSSLHDIRPESTYLPVMSKKETENHFVNKVS